MDLNGKRVLVVGLGKSGVASALFLKSHGAHVTVSDTKSEDQLRDQISALLDEGIAVETGSHSARTLQNQDLVVSRVVGTAILGLEHDRDAWFQVVLRQFDDKRIALHVHDLPRPVDRSLLL